MSCTWVGKFRHCSYSIGQGPNVEVAPISNYNLETGEIATGWFTNSRNKQQARPMSKSIFYLDPIVSVLIEGPQQYVMFPGVNVDFNMVSNSLQISWVFSHKTPVSIVIYSFGETWRNHYCLTCYGIAVFHSGGPLQSTNSGSKTWLRSRKWAKNQDFLFGWLPSASWFPLMAVV